MELFLSIMLVPLFAISIVALLVSSGLVFIPMAIFNWVVNTPISFIKAPVVLAGWELSRDFVNILFVLILIIIGLATVLGIENYKAKKALPMLVLAIILINFSPVICGVFIDLANIIMNVFKDPAIAAGGILSTSAGNITSYVLKEIPKVMGNYPPGFIINPDNLIVSIGFFGLIISGVLFNILLFGALAIYALVFFVRIVVLWILIIVSPFAFLGFFFPKWPIVGSIQKQWTGQFFQWTFIGIPLFFFLYLAQEMISIPVCSGTIITGEGNPFAVALNGDIMCLMLSLFFPIAFLLAGFAATLSFGLKGGEAQKVMDWGKKQGQKIGTKTLTAARDIPVVTRAEGAIRKRMENTPLGNAFGMNPGSFEIDQKKRRDEAGKGLEDASPDTLRRTLSGFMVDPKRKAKALEVLLKRNKITNEDKKYVENAKTYGFNEKAVYDALPHWEDLPDIRKKVEGMEAEEFRKNVSPLAFETPAKTVNGKTTGPEYSDEQLEVFYSMDMMKVEELSKGSKNKRTALRRLIINRSADIAKEINKLSASTRQEDNDRADNIKAMFQEIMKNSNFK